LQEDCEFTARVIQIAVNQAKLKLEKQHGLLGELPHDRHTPDRAVFISSWPVPCENQGSTQKPGKAPF